MAPSIMDNIHMFMYIIIYSIHTYFDEIFCFCLEFLKHLQIFLVPIETELYKYAHS